MNKGAAAKIRLSIMPFWSPLTPPLGISCLKAYLEQYGYDIHTKDYNTISALYAYGNQYISLIKSFIPSNEIGNVSMIGYDILALHLCAYNNRENNDDYYELVRLLILKNFFHKADDGFVEDLCKLVDCFYKLFSEHLMAELNENEIDIYGISCYSLTLGPSIFAFKLIKSNYPNIKTIMGGGVFADQLSPSFVDFAEFTEKTPFIDHFVIGEGEILFLNLIRSNFHNSPRVIINDNLIEKVCLNSVPSPDFSNFDMSSYPQLSAYTSRSCPYRCGFCSETMQWGEYRSKESKDIVHELRSMVDRYNKNIIVFADSLLNLNIDALADDMILQPQNEKLYWDAYLRVCDMANSMDTVTKWRKAGLYRVRLGVESGSQKVLNLMNKRITVENIKTNIKTLAKAGIKISTYWVVGYPGETDEDFEDTLKLLRELKEYIYEADPHPYYFYPSGQAEKFGEKYNYERVYPENYCKMLMFSTWQLNKEPLREKIYERLQLFDQCCSECDIRNPYSLMEIYRADKRWKNIHASSVPMMHDLINKGVDIVDEYRDCIVLKHNNRNL